MPLLGREIQTGRPVELTAEARRQGVYVIGTTGTGKTTLLQNIAYQDMEAGEGLCVLDPHGDFIDALLLRVPERRKDDVILFAPGDREQVAQPLGLNIFDCDRNDPQQVMRVVSTVMSTLYKLFAYSWGPRMEELLRRSILTLMRTPGTTFLELLLLLVSPNHRERFTSALTAQSDAELRHFWEVQFPLVARDSRAVAEVVGSSLNKIGRFLADPRMLRVVAQQHSAFNMRRIMDEGKILLVNLSKGDLGEDNSSLLGAVLVNLVLTAALQRREIAPADRRQFHLIVDEYQAFATESFPTLQSEARKYAIDVMVAHQYRDQLDDLNKGSTLNVANFIVMRVSGRDSYDLAAQFDNTPPEPEVKMEPVYRQQQTDPRTGETVFVTAQRMDGAGTQYHQVKQQPRPYSDVVAEKANQLSILSNWGGMCRLVEGRDLKEYTFDADVPRGVERPDVARYIREKSAALGVYYGDVDADIAERIGDDLSFDDIPPLEEL